MSRPAAGHLLLERDGQLWAVPGSAVDRLERRGGRVTVRLAADAVRGEDDQPEALAALAADRLLAVSGDLCVRPAPAALSRFWPEPAAGLAVWARRPVVVIDPARPPRTLAAAADSGGSR